MIPDYLAIEQHYLLAVSKLKRITGWLSFFRLISLGLAAFFFYRNSVESSFSNFALALFLLVTFVYLVVLYLKYKSKLTNAQTFAWVNRSEFEFIQNNTCFYPNGSEFLNEQHPFAHDIDLFGKHSLFEHLNRTSTVSGSKQLAHDLSAVFTEVDLRKRQEAIDELSTDLEWTQAFQVYAKLGEDNTQVLAHIQTWKANTARLSFISLLCSILFPFLGAASMILLWQTGNSFWFNLGVILFIINLLCYSLVNKSIKTEIDQLDNIGASFTAYGKLLELIAEKQWKSQLLIDWQQTIIHNNQSAHLALKKAGKISNKLESANNGLVVMFMDGTLQYHIHAYRQLLHWKNNYQQQVSTWIEQIGKMESLLSLSRFKANNPSYVFPMISDKLSFEELGHPLIESSKRVNNSIDFSQQKIVILTGSNMSGKSTFLRSLGSAIVLSNVGSVVPASKASFYPIPLLASIRLSDSLSENSSYFFAEVQRLKTIMEHLKTKEAFVLLDEILRGTNSDDKVAGTIGVINKLTTYHASGIIATHDLDVCKLAENQPNSIKNLCFEAELKDNELYFDYRLRPGICKNKSATFIMKQNNII
jgi:hypothetical protein